MGRTLAAAVGSLVLVVIIICGWGRSTVRYPLEPGRLYAVQVTSNEAVIDLPLGDAREQYLLVVANAGRSGAEMPVELSSRRIDEADSRSLSAVAPLKPLSKQVSFGQTAPTAKRQKPPVERTFWLLVDGGSSKRPPTYSRITARLAGEGRATRVYVDADDQVVPETVDAIIELLETSVRSTCTKFLGSLRDVDGDGAFSVVLTGRLGSLEGGRVSLGGMVCPADFRDPPTSRFSNCADVLYLNARLRPGRHLETLLAHELAHAVAVSGRLGQGTSRGGPVEDEAWLNEAIAHVAENLQSDNWSNLDYRLASYLSDPGVGSLVVADYRQAGRERDPALRGATYLFLRWCVDQFGIEILPRLIHSTYVGTKNLEVATGCDFSDLYRRFTAELFLQSARVASPESQTAASQELPAIDLSSPLGHWGLAGPRTEGWQLDNPHEAAPRLTLAPTAARHVVVWAASAGPRRVRLKAPSGSKLLVSLVRLPDEMARLKLDVEPLPSGKWRIALREQSGTDVVLSHVAWETLDPSRVTSGRPSHVYLADERLSQLLGQCDLAGSEALLSRPIEFRGMPRAPLSVRVVGTDRHGHRVAAWASVDLSQGGVQVAATNLNGADASE